MWLSTRRLQHWGALVSALASAPGDGLVARAEQHRPERVGERTPEAGGTCSTGGDGMQAAFVGNAPELGHTWTVLAFGRALAVTK